MDPIDIARIQAAGPPAAPSAAPRQPRNGASFRDVLEQASGQAVQRPGVRFSKHAQARLDRREIELTPDHLTRLNDAVDRARARGARESLVLMDDIALVVSVRNQTVITATSADSRQENVFTNIDSAVIA